MKKTFIIIIFLIVVIVLAGLGIYWFYNINNKNTEGVILNSTQTQTTDNIRLGSSSPLESFLVDANGKTLYYFANDMVGKSNCSGQCSVIWPPFFVSTVSVSGSLNATDFGQIKTSSGADQTTYQGWPLYYFSGDKSPGDTNGQGFQNIWFVAKFPFYNVMLVNNSKSKTYLSDVNGKTLYYFKNDIAGTATADPQSNCIGQCLSMWTIFDEQQVIAPSLLDENNFKEFTRADGDMQLSYKGRPLYYFSQDSQPGDIKGDGLNKLWYLVKP